MVAAGGVQGDVKLVDVAQQLCYAQLGGHTAAVLALTVHPSCGRWLLSADAGGGLRLWDIGVPTGANHQCNARCCCSYPACSAVIPLLMSAA